MYKNNFEKNNFLAENKVCFHSRNLTALFDLEKGDENFSLLFSHLKNCKICQKEFKYLESQNLALKNEIPRPLLNHEERKSLNLEIHELFKVFELDNSVKIKKSFLNQLINFNSTRKEMLMYIFSPQKLTLYILSGTLIYCLKMFF